MKFTIHTHRPNGECGQRLGSRPAEGETLLEAMQAAIKTLRPNEIPIAWSPEPSRSHGGTKSHMDLCDEARSLGRSIIYNGPAQWTCGAQLVDNRIPEPAAKSNPRHCGRHGIIFDCNVHASCPACALPTGDVQVDHHSPHGERHVLDSAWMKANRLNGVTAAEMLDGEIAKTSQEPGVFYDGHVLTVTQAVPATGEVVNAEVDKTPIAATMEERDECGRKRDRARITSMVSKGFDPFREYIVKRGGQAGHYPRSTAGGVFATENSPDMRRTSAQIDPTHAGAAQAWHGK